MRAAFLALALLLAAAPAFAQSDTRKVALWHTNQAVLTTGNMAAGSSQKAQSEVMTQVEVALRRMGVPFTVFNMRDSTGGWASQMGATRPAGVADSTWFRQNGYMLNIMVLTSLGSSTTTDPVGVFTDARVRGNQTGSPMDGTWGTPTIIFSVFATNNAGIPYRSGANGTNSSSAPQFTKGAFADNGDSLSVVISPFYVLSTLPDSITKIIHAGDTLDATGVSAKAWRWRNSTYYYSFVDAGNPVPVLIGLADMFWLVGYAPRRKLNLHYTLDHIYPENTSYTAPSDSFFAYVRANGWRFSTMVKAHGAAFYPAAGTSEYAGALDPLRVKWNAIAREMRWPHVPHSHVVGVGNWMQSTSWNLTTWADSALKRQRWNFLERAISDTLMLPQAQGYERTIGFPSEDVAYPDLDIVAQNGYTDVRCVDTDSIYREPSLRAIRKVNVGQNSASYPAAFPNLPHRFFEPTTGRPIWIHAIMSHPGATGNLWEEQAGLNSSDIHGYTAANLRLVARAIWADADFYWHPNECLEQADASTTNPIAVYSRRLTYFLNRIKNICTVEPSYRPKYPRRSSIPRG